MVKLNLTGELTIRVCLITIIFAIISYFLVQTSLASPGQSEITIPMLFVLYGVVILISILYSLRRYHAGNATR
jgi:hypothetical protein